MGLLMTIAIVGILTVVSIPMFSTMIQNHRADLAANNLFEDLQNARSMAIKNNVNIYASFSMGDSWCYGFNSGSACDCTNASSCSLGVVSAPAAKQLSLSSTGLSGNSIYFDGVHASSSASAELTFTVYGTDRLITLSIARFGNIKMCSTNIDGYPSC